MPAKKDQERSMKNQDIRHQIQLYVSTNDNALACKKIYNLTKERDRDDRQRNRQRT